MQKIDTRWNTKMGEDPKRRYWMPTWLDEVSDLLWRRKLELQSPKVEQFCSISNKPLIEYALGYTATFQLSSEVLYYINYMRMKKRYIYHVN